jgi:hypothetical protein
VSNDSDTNASEASTDSRATTVGDWNGPLPKEDSVTRMHRIQQGLWRAEKLHWPAGEPQKDRRVRDRYPTLPNWLAEPIKAPPSWTRDRTSCHARRAHIRGIDFEFLKQ